MARSTPARCRASRSTSGKSNATVAGTGRPSRRDSLRARSTATSESIPASKNPTVRGIGDDRPIAAVTSAVISASSSGSAPDGVDVDGPGCTGGVHSHGAGGAVRRPSAPRSARIGIDHGGPRSAAANAASPSASDSGITPSSAQSPSAAIPVDHGPHPIASPW
ncbi:MAG: hypothetical protein ABMB14_32530, partial [Myxococcota bacterium]